MAFHVYIFNTYVRKISAQLSKKYKCACFIQALKHVREVKTSLPQRWRLLHVHYNLFPFFISTLTSFPSVLCT